MLNNILRLNHDTFMATTHDCQIRMFKFNNHTNLYENFKNVKFDQEYATGLAKLSDEKIIFCAPFSIFVLDKDFNIIKKITTPDDPENRPKRIEGKKCPYRGVYFP